MAQRVALEVSVDWLRRRHRGVISRLLDRLYDLPWHLPAELLYPPLERFWLRIRGGIGIFFGVWGPVVLTMIAFLGLPMSTYISDQVQVDCTIRIPGHPLDSQGLATPWVLSGGNQCLEKKNSGAVFAEAMVLDTDTGQVAVYDPLVVDRGSKPAAAPVVPALPDQRVTAIWTTFNGDHLTLAGPGRTSCSQGSESSVLPQMASCNAAAFFQAANDARQSGKLQVPALEKAKDKQPCPTSRDYSLVPNYQSMNSGARYLVTSDGTTAQDTAQNMAALPNASKQFSGSQEGQFRGAVNHALGCNEWRATDLADPTHMVDSIALNELQAAADQGSSAALTPYNAPFVMSGRKPDLAKLNAYRTALDQPTVATLDQADPHDYCQNLLSQGLPRIVLDKKLTVGQASPLPTAASNLYNLEALRFHNAYSELGCTKQLENVNPITLKMEKNLVVGVDITLNPRSTAKRPPALMPTPNDQNVNQQNPVAPPPEQGPWSGWRSGVRGGGQGGVVPAVPNVNGIIGSIFGGGGGGGSGGGWIPSTGNYSNSSWGGTSTSTAGQAFPGQSISSAGQGIPGRSGSARPGW